MTKLRSALGVARGLGPSKDALHHWWMQRLTGAALVPLGIWFVFAMTALVGADLATYAAWIKLPWNTTLMVLFIACVFHHFQLGLQVVIEDYITPEHLKVPALVLNKFAAVFFGASSIFAVFRVAYGG